jgi:CPA2 family monovalent cation:H+ antiporter-2
MLLDPGVLLEHPGPVAALVLLLVLGKLGMAGLAVMLMRFPARVAILSGLTLAQVGEFSFVLLRAGEDAGIADEKTSAVFLAASVLTMIAAPLLVGWSPRLAAGAGLLRPLERLLAIRGEEAEAAKAEAPLEGHVVVVGLGLGGQTLLRGLQAVKVPCLGLDLHPEAIVGLRGQGLPIRYGDITSVEVMDHVAQVRGARQVVLLLSDAAAARRAALTLRARHPHVPVLVRVQRLGRDAPLVDLPGVQVIAEDQEVAIEVVERVLRGVGAAGELVAAAVAAARGTRDGEGLPTVSAANLAGALHLQGVPLSPGSAMSGQTLAALDLRAKTGALVVALGRAGAVRPSPRPDEALEPGDTLFLVGTPGQVASAAAALAGPPPDPGAPA